MVDLPEAERPVSQMVRPRWWVRWMRWAWVRPGCQVMFLFFFFFSISFVGRVGEGREEGRTLPFMVVLLARWANFERGAGMDARSGRVYSTVKLSTRLLFGGGSICALDVDARHDFFEFCGWCRSVLSVGCKWLCHARMAITKLAMIKCYLAWVFNALGGDPLRVDHPLRAGACCFGIGPSVGLGCCFF